MEVSDVRRLILGTANRTKLIILEELYKQGLLKGEDYKTIDGLDFNLGIICISMKDGDLNTDETLRNLRFLKADRSKKIHDTV